MFRIFIFFEIASAFGVLFRISTELARKNLVSRSVMTKIVLASLSMIVILAFLFRQSVFVFSFLVWSGVLFAFLSEKMIARRNRDLFLRELPRLLDNTVLNMKVGQSFRSALQSASHDLSPFSKIKIRNVMNGLSLLPAKSAPGENSGPEEATLIAVFYRIEAENHRALQRLEQLRYKLRVEQDFRSRVKRALVQLKAQSYFLSALYVCLLGFVYFRFGFRGNERLIGLSLVLYLAGIYFTRRVGRGFQWKV